MPEASLDRHQRAAEGFLELGLPLDGWEELEQIAPERRGELEVILLRIRILAQLARWEEVLVIGEGAAAHYPNCGRIYSFSATAAYSIGRPEIAIDILKLGIQRLPSDPDLAYTLACFLCQVGDVKNSREILSSAFDLDPNLRLKAIKDPDLEPLWDSLGGPIA